MAMTINSTEGENMVRDDEMVRKLTELALVKNDVGFLSVIKNEGNFVLRFRKSPSDKWTPAGSWNSDGIFKGRFPAHDYEIFSGAINFLHKRLCKPKL